MASTTKKSTRPAREVALLPVKSIPAKERTPKQKLERRLLGVLYHGRKATDPNVKATLKKDAAKLERQIKAVK